jgi:hypothetical protein
MLCMALQQLSAPCLPLVLSSYMKQEQPAPHHEAPAARLLPAYTPLQQAASPPPPLQGSVVLRQPVKYVAKVRDDGSVVERTRVEAAVVHCDIIRDEFWQQHPELLKC